MSHLSGRTLAERQKTDEAEQIAQEALKFAQAGGDLRTHGQALLTIGMIRHTQGIYVEADQFFAQALALLERSHSHEAAAYAYFRYATLLEHRGDVQSSLTAIKQAYNHQRREKHGECGEG